MSRTLKIILIASSTMVVGGTMWYLFAQDKKRNATNKIIINPSQASDILRQIQQGK